jgi:hypothetical protein
MGWGHRLLASPSNCFTLPQLSEGLLLVQNTTDPPRTKGRRHKTLSEQLAVQHRHRGRGVPATRWLSKPPCHDAAAALDMIDGCAPPDCPCPRALLWAQQQLVTSSSDVCCTGSARQTIPLRLGPILPTTTPCQISSPCTCTARGGGVLVPAALLPTTRPGVS